MPGGTEMIKLTFCLKRLPHLTREEFQSYWRDVHAPLVKRHSAALKIARYVQSHSLPQSTSSPLAQSRGSAGQDFDGVAELWWTDMETFASAGLTPEGQEAGRILLEDEARFIDLPNSPIFLVDEYQVIG
jgi:uncharacterized protein (TIGR02118 family)